VGAGASRYERRARAGAVIGALALAGCGRVAPVPPSCEELGVAIEAAGPAERRVLGDAAPYEADRMLAARSDELARSQRARRAAAWAAVARVLRPVPIAESTAVGGADVPAFRTWYDREDLNRMFQHAYEGMGAERRAVRSPFEPSELDATLAWNTRAVDEIVGWSPERFDEYVAGLHAQRQIDGLGGIRRILLSPSAMRHVLASYPQIMRCVAGEHPPAFIDGSASTQSLARLEVDLARCHERLEGPFFVASGSTLSARASADSIGAVDARLAILPSIDGLPGAPRCENDAMVGCTVEGPGPFFVSLHAGARTLHGVLEVEAAAPSRVSPGCLAGPFPSDAVTVAAHWTRADLAMPMPTFDTSARALRRRFDGGDASWGAGDGMADPGEDRIYTMTVPAGPSFRLAGFHIRTREIDTWLNITLWWSPDPDTDFGADRPEAIRALGGPWSSYKMCVAVDYTERDETPGGGFEDDAPTLADALTEVHDRASWCSNPYIDAAPGLLRGNCLGCHQHAMAGRFPGEVALDTLRFPDGARGRTRNNEPADGFWSFEAGDDFGSVLRETISWWDASE
jgi:hypothetical protein